MANTQKKCTCKNCNAGIMVTSSGQIAIQTEEGLLAVQLTTAKLLDFADQLLSIVNNRQQIQDQADNLAELQPQGHA